MPRSDRPDRPRAVRGPSARASARPPFVAALPAVLALLLAASLLSACGVLLRPRLEVEGGPLAFDAARTCLRLRLVNDGSPWTTLSWTAEDPSGLLTVSPASGRIRTSRTASGSQVVTVRARPAAVPAGTTATGTLAFAYDAGVLEVPFEVQGSGAAGAAPGREGPAPQLPSQLPPQLPYVPGRVLMRAGTPFARSALAPSADPAALAASARLQAAAVRAEHGLELLRDGGGVGPDLVRVTGDPVEVAARLEADPRVAYAHPDWRLEPLAVPDDPLLADKWTAEPIGLVDAWEVTTGESGHEVVLAVLDSGVDAGHEDLRGRVLPGRDVHDDDDDASPGCSNGGDAEHGTHVAGIAAATGGNGVGIAGVAPGAAVRILPVKLFDDTGRRGSLDDLIEGMLWAAGLAEGPGPARPADVINMSVGAGARTAAAVDETAARVAAAGVVLVASAGNAGSAGSSSGVQTPANAPDVIAVGSIDADGTRSYFSDFDPDGSGIDLMAPGGAGPSSCRAVLSTLPGDDYGCLAGTSMASPVVAGAAALLLTQVDLPPEEVRARLRASARFDPALMQEDRYGAGVLCVDRLVGAPTLCGEAP